MDEQTNIPDFTDEDKIESNFHDFNSNPEIIGILKDISQGAYGDQYEIQIGKGEVVTVGTYDVLKSKILKTDIGKWIKIVCKGDTISPKTKRKYKDFEVFVKRK